MEYWHYNDPFKQHSQPDLMNNYQPVKKQERSLTLAMPVSRASANSRMEQLIPLIVITLVLLCNRASAQNNISEIITDFGGFWKSGVGSINSTKPDSSHNLLSFSFLGNRYSTGVDDAKLTAHGINFTPGDYRALAVTGITGAVNGNTKIGLGARNDGNLNGPSNPAPINNMALYLSDGIKGLDIGTCVANLPAGTMFYAVSNVRLQAIADNIADILITQTADPSSSYDRYEFTDVNGTRVGNYVDINLNGIPAVGNWVADFYEASNNPMTLAGGYTKTDRPIRLWAADFSAFGINASNISQIAYFKIRLSGTSDVAFVSYNQNAINMANSILPVKLTSFSGKVVDNLVQLNWQTSSEMNSDRFVIESATDGTQFKSIDSVRAAGSSSASHEYKFAHAPVKAGTIYYRLKQVDRDGNIEYSRTVTVNYNPIVNKISAYPNPTTSYMVINHPVAGNAEKLQVYSMNGLLVFQKNLAENSIQTRVELSSLPKGSYQAVLIKQNEKSSLKIIVQ